LMAALMRLKAGQSLVDRAPERPDAGCPAG